MARYDGYAHSTAMDLHNKRGDTLLSVGNYCYEIETREDVFFGKYVDCDVIVVPGVYFFIVKLDDDDVGLPVKILRTVDAVDAVDVGLTETEADRIASVMLKQSKQHVHNNKFHNMREVCDRSNGWRGRIAHVAAVWHNNNPKLQGWLSC